MLFFRGKESERNFSDFEFNKKVIICLTFILLLLLAYGYMYGTYVGVKNHLIINDKLYYISEVGYLAPAIFLVPFPILAIIGGVQKLLGKENNKTAKHLIKSLLYGVPLYVAFSIICSFYIEANLKNYGYTYCSWYKFSPTRSPDVWLKNSELCLKVHHYVVLDVEEWFEWHNEQGIEPQLDELKAFIAKVNKEQGR
ncbi:DUF1240 domain-containing protein [Pseudoalteromonas arabiensis]|uniref:DUF1240 domain-containing protein n=1 Tax=Pseudoalteromonas arabiensis TaxID=874454 RepID=UPI000785977A|nr:DUF1240 domain-containing protein [Pseudoalteromonas arabiensis]